MTKDKIQKLAEAMVWHDIIDETVYYDPENLEQYIPVAVKDSKAEEWNLTEAGAFRVMVGMGLDVKTTEYSWIVGEASFGAFVWSVESESPHTAIALAALAKLEAQDG